jgi:aerobic carbon-monoxide dehydrogenase medium subunit
MKPPPFEYYAPRSLDEALGLLDRFAGDARILAGGQSLVPLMNMRLARPQRIVDINRLAELDYIRINDDYLSIGALTRHRAIEQSQTVLTACPLLSKAAGFVGHPQVRSRGTIGGSLAHADPAAEYPAVAAALDAEIKLRSVRGDRIVGWRQFFVGDYATEAAPDEILVEVRFPRPRGSTACEFRELSRRHGDFALVEAAVQIEFDESKKCSRAAIGLGGVGGMPFRASLSEEILRGKLPGKAIIQEAASAATENLDPVSDVHASAAYRKQMVSLLVSRALERATGLHSVKEA